MIEENEIEEQFNEANARAVERSRYFGMTYEQGVRDALGWAIGEIEEPPFEI